MACADAGACEFHEVLRVLVRLGVFNCRAHKIISAVLLELLERYERHGGRELATALDKDLEP